MPNLDPVLKTAIDMAGYYRWHDVWNFGEDNEMIVASTLKQLIDLT